jgi:hypothetical protein
MRDDDLAARLAVEVGGVRSARDRGQYVGPSFGVTIPSMDSFPSSFMYHKMQDFSMRQLWEVYGTRYSHCGYFGGSSFSNCAVHWLIRSPEYPILVFLKVIDITEAWNLSFVLETVIEFVSCF